MRSHYLVIYFHLLVPLNIVIMEKSRWLFIIMIDSCIYMAYVLNVYLCVHYMFFVVYVKRNLILILLFSVHFIIMVCPMNLLLIIFSFLFFLRKIYLQHFHVVKQDYHVRNVFNQLFQ